MKNHLWIPLFFVLAVLFGFSGLSFAEHFRAGTSEWVPYSMILNGEVEGVSVDILKEIGKRTGDTFEIQILPVKRLRKELLDGQIDLNIADSPEWATSEEGASEFSEPYLFVDEFIYFRNDNFVNVSEAKDLFGKSVATVRGYFYAMFGSAFKKKQVKLEEVTTSPELLKMLNAKRVDAIFLDNLNFRFVTNSMKLRASDYKQGLRLTHSPLALRTFKDRAKAAMARFSSAIKDIKKDGTIEKILARY